MIGVAIGVIFSIVIFTIYTKDNKAITEFKKKKQEDQQKKTKQIKQQQEKLEKLEKMKNDPALIKKKEEVDTKIKNKLYEGLNEADRKLLEDYLDEQKKSGKSDEQIIKEATKKAGIFMCLLMMIIFVMVFCVLMLTTEAEIDFTKTFSQVHKFVGLLYPKLAPNSLQNINSKIAAATQQGQL